MYDHNINMMGSKSPSKELVHKTLQMILEKPNLQRALPAYATDFIGNKIISLINDFLFSTGSQLILVQEKNPEFFKNSYELFCEISDRPERFDKAREQFSNEDSKKIFDWFIAYRIAYIYLSSQAIYAINSPISPKKIKQLKKIASKYKKRSAFRYENYTIKTNEQLFIATWLLEQYNYKNICQPIPGDVIIDVGACEGETSLWFADKIREKGLIYAFEPDLSNFKTLTQNILDNHLSSVIIPENYGLWRERTSMNFSGAGGTFSIQSNGETSVNVQQLDQFIEENDIKKIDFIKMDIEGAEMGALEGATNTIRSLKPKMAIAVYHDYEDIVTIPNFLKTLVPEYRLYLNHYTTNYGETILYAMR